MSDKDFELALFAPVIACRDVPLSSNEINPICTSAFSLPKDIFGCFNLHNASNVCNG